MIDKNSCAIIDDIHRENKAVTNQPLRVDFKRKSIVAKSYHTKGSKAEIFIYDTI